MESCDCYVQPDRLRVKQVYFMISFLDRDMRVPEIATVVYLGRDIFHENDAKHYFQEYSQFVEGSARREAAIIAAAEDNLMNFFDYEGASQLVRMCGIR